MPFFCKDFVCFVKKMSYSGQIQKNDLKKDVCVVTIRIGRPWVNINEI